MTESNIIKISDTAEKMELEFSYEENLDAADTSASILPHVRKHGDIGPDCNHYDLQQIKMFRKLPKA